MKELSRNDLLLIPLPSRMWEIGSILTAAIAIVLSVAILSFDLGRSLLIVGILGFVCITFLHARSLYLVRAAYQRTRTQVKTFREEAWTLHNATLALTQDFRMNRVLDRLLEMLRQVVPYERAQVLLLETETKFFLARETRSHSSRESQENFPETLDVSGHLLLQRALGNRDGILISDTAREADFLPIAGMPSIRSWIIVPVYSSGQSLGLLSLCHTNAAIFTKEHLRLASSIAIAGAVAVQNARLYERSEIYAEELERNLANLREAKETIEMLKNNRRRFES